MRSLDGLRASDLKEAVEGALDDPERHERLKRLMMEAHEEWLEKKWAEFGKWTARGFMALVFSAIIYLALKAKGVL